MEFSFKFHQTVGALARLFYPCPGHAVAVDMSFDGFQLAIVQFQEANQGFAPFQAALVIVTPAGTRGLNRVGLPYGDKIANRARIPKWAFQRKSWLAACLRGLFDTDGCVYGFKRLPPARGSKAIISYEFGSGSIIPKDVYKALCKLGYAARMRTEKNECKLTANKDIERFMNEIKPANRKHRNNFARWHGPVV